MRNVVCIVSLILLFVLYPGFSFAQTTTINTSDAARTDRDKKNEADLNRRMFDMRALEPRMRELDKRDRQMPVIPELDKAAKERVMRMRKLDPQDISEYAGFLKEEKTGIFKLFPNLECVTENLIRVDGACSAFVPMSSDFSFRDVGYTDHMYNDIEYVDGEIVSNGFFSQGILVSLGNVSLDPDISKHPALKYLTELKSSSKPSEAKKMAAKLKDGIFVQDLKYSNRAPVAANTTYALRLIAYKFGNSLPPPSVNSSMTELKFLSLSLDKRVDLTVVFRVVRNDPDGGITIVWKELSRTDAPTLKFGSDETIADFKRQ